MKNKNLPGLLLILFMMNIIIPSFLTGGEKLQNYTIEDYFKVASMRIRDMTRDGRFIACTVSTRQDRLPRNNYRFGDPTYIGPFLSKLVVINTGTKKNIFPYKTRQQIRQLKWSPDGTMLAFFISKRGKYEPVIWHRKNNRLQQVRWNRRTKYGGIAQNSHLIWSTDGEQLHFAVRSKSWGKESRKLFAYATKNPIMIQDSDNKFLLWDRLWRKRNILIPVVWDLRRRKTAEVMPESRILSYRLTRGDSRVIYERDVTEKTDYDIIFGTEKQLEIIDQPGKKPRILLKKYKRRRFYWSLDCHCFAYQSKGDIFNMNIKDSEPRNLTSPDKKNKEKKNTEKDKNKKKSRAKFSYGILALNNNGSKILYTKSQKPDPEKKGEAEVQPLDYLIMDIDSGKTARIYQLTGKRENRPRLRFVHWNGKSESILFTYSAPDRYERGLNRLSVPDKKMSPLLRSSHLFRGFRVSENGQAIVYSDSDGNFPPEWFAANGDLKEVIRLSRLNPQLEHKSLSHTKLISYRDIDGKKLYGILYLPADYQKGEKYPLITEVYERFFDNGFHPVHNIFTAQGYAVLRPSVNLIRGYPGEAWAKGALAAVNKVVELGIADPDKLGIQGTSYGGYATVLLLTQTSRFKAAINNSGKVNMVSFYTQSPRIGVRNTHAPEKSQDRIGGTLWQYPERYLSHSAIMEADRITTPLLCITGGQDHNVEALQSAEIYYALRRLGKKVVWLNYRNGGHGGPHTAAERKDMYQRILAWYDKYLKGIDKKEKPGKK